MRRVLELVAGPVGGQLAVDRVGAFGRVRVLVRVERARTARERIHLRSRHRSASTTRVASQRMIASYVSSGGGPSASL